MTQRWVTVLTLAVTMSAGCTESPPPTVPPSPSNPPVVPASSNDIGDSTTTLNLREDAGPPIRLVREGEEDSGAATRSDDPPSDAGLGRLSLASIIATKRSAFDGCLALAASGISKGYFGLRVVVNPSGQVKVAEAVPEDTDINDKGVIACVVGHVLSLSFPPHPKGMESTYKQRFLLRKPKSP